MLKLIKEYKEKKAFKAFITDKVERLIDSYKANRLESEGKISIVNHYLYSEYDYWERYEVVVITLVNGEAHSDSYIFRSNTPHSNDNDLQLIKDTIDKLWQERMDNKRANVVNNMREKAKYYQQAVLDNEVIKMGLDKHLVDITFSETKVDNSIAMFTINVANLKYLDKNNDVIIKHYNLNIVFDSHNYNYYHSANLGAVVNSITSYITGLDKYVAEQDRLKQLMKN